MSDRSRGTLIAVALALFCIQIDFFGLNLALPAMARSFHVDAGSIQWAVSAYMLSLGSLFILAGRIGDIFGRRRALLCGIATFGLASAGCALAPSLPVLVACRVVQGAGAAVIFPVGIGAVSNAFGEERRAWALGLAFGFGNIGMALGPFAGGGLSSGPGWRWVFWLLVPLCAAALLVAARSVGESREESAPRRLDVRGAALVALGVAILSIGVDRASAWGWGSPLTIGAIALAPALFAAFFATEARVRAPLVDLQLFRNLPYVLVTGMGAAVNVGYSVMIFGATLYLQLVRGLSPLSAGFVFLAPSILVSLTGPIGARLEKVARPAIVMAGAAIVGSVGLVAFSYAHAWIVLVPVFGLAGIGYGMGFTFANIGTQEVVDPARAGEASGTVLTALVTAGGVGIAAAASVIDSLQRAGVSRGAAIDGTLRVVALLVLVVAAAVLALRHELVHRGLIAPASMRAAWTPPSALRTPLAHGAPHPAAAVAGASAAASDVP